MATLGKTRDGMRPASCGHKSGCWNSALSFFSQWTPNPIWGGLGCGCSNDGVLGSLGAQPALGYVHELQSKRGDLWVEPGGDISKCSHSSLKPDLGPEDGRLM